MSALRPLAISATLAALHLAACASDSDIDVSSESQSIIGGSPTNAGDFPAVGALVDPMNTPICSGTLIAPNVVLTAAHCLLDKLASEMFFTLDQNAITARNRIAAKQLIVHDALVNKPLWYVLVIANGMPDIAQLNDIGLVILAAPVNGVEPVALPASNTALTNGQMVSIVGYGQTTATGTPGYKFDALTDVVAVGDFEIQLSSSGQPMNCRGDSGGPSLAAMDGIERVVGVVSRARKSDCSTGSIHTRVSAYADWIRNNLAANGISLVEKSPSVPSKNAAGESDASGCSATGNGSSTAPVTAVMLGLCANALRRRRRMY